MDRRLSAHHTPSFQSMQALMDFDEILAKHGLNNAYFESKIYFKKYWKFQSFMPNHLIRMGKVLVKISTANVGSAPPLAYYVYWILRFLKSLDHTSWSRQKVLPPINLARSKMHFLFRKSAPPITCWIDKIRWSV